MKIIVIGNQKGGVGKTTIALNVAGLAVEQGAKTLLVDLDTQGSTTLAVIDDSTTTDLPSLSASLWDNAQPIAPLHSKWGFDILCASKNLAGADSLSLDESLTALRRIACYDVVVIDTPPAEGMRQLAPMCLADTLVIPVEPDTYAVNGLAQMMSLVSDARPHNRRLITWVLVNRLNKLSRAQATMVSGLRDALGDTLMPVKLTARECVRIARDNKQTVWQLAKKSSVAQDWLTTCEIILH